MNVKNVLIENFSTETTIEEEGLITASDGGSVDGIKFSNLKLAGKPATSLNASKIKTSGPVSNLTFTTGAR